MKLRRWHLYLIATVMFIGCFTALNFKYDRFYRVNGINNDNRALMEMYLSESEQDYLIENAIAVDQFIDYIQLDNFKLENYRYYNSLKQLKTYPDNNVLMDEGNTLQTNLSVEYGTNAYNRFETLIKNDLVNSYLNQEGFNFDNIPYYQLTRTLYNDDDYTYITHTNYYLNVIESENNFDDDELLTTYKHAVNSYNAPSLYTLITTQLQPDVRRVYDINLFNQVVNNQAFISSYEPKHLVMIEGIPRISYSMYLQVDAYNALSNMNKAMDEAIDDNFIVTKSYTSYDVLALNTTSELAGFSEYQLGTTVNIKEEGISDADFVSTQMYQWLINNSYQYGYILRYPSDKTMITNHEYDATRFRYVGVEIATQLLFR